MQVSHRVHVTSSNIEGDQQSDLSVHGGPEKAVYAYPAEHYDFWRRELPDATLAWGAFNGTRRYEPSAWRASVATRRLTWSR
jgi:MOSC domain-containing protein YiiM